VAELYSAVLIVGIVVALSYLVFAHAVVPRHLVNAMVVAQQYTIYGKPSLLFLQLDSSRVVNIDELRVDTASSLSGVLYLGQNGYGVIEGLCAPGLTTFFSVFAPVAGNLAVVTNGQPWVDGNRVSSETVRAGWHEVIIMNGSTCEIALPGGESLSTLAGSVSTIPMIRSINSTSIESYAPYATNGHSITLVSEAGVETLGF
jgi:hypothetical protein